MNSPIISNYFTLFNIYVIVMLATEKATGVTFAVKIINKQRVKIKTFQNEISIIRKLKEKCTHMNVLKYYEICK